MTANPALDAAGQQTGPASPEIAAWLTRSFGGAWQHGEGGPGTSLWAQCRTDTDGRTVLVGMLLLSDGITSARLRAIAVRALEQAAVESADSFEDLAALPSLERGDQPADDFYRLVAAYFTAWASRSPNPVAEMARASGEKPATVHSWVSRARQRGLLPEAERGKRARSHVLKQGDTARREDRHSR